MKNAILAILIFSSSVLHAQQAAEAAAATAQQTAKQDFWHSETITKWTTSIEKAQTQIEKAQKVIDLTNKIIEVAGDPASAVSFVTGEMNIKAPNLKPIMELGKSAQKAASGAQSLANNSEGVFKSIPDKLKSGFPIDRDFDAYKPFDVLEKNFDNFKSITEDSDKELLRILDDMKKIQEKPATTEAQQRERTAALIVKQAEVAVIQERKRTAEQLTHQQFSLNVENQRKADQASVETAKAADKEIGEKRAEALRRN